MIRSKEIRQIFRDQLPKGRPVDLSEVFAIVKMHCSFDREDLEPHDEGGHTLKWEHQVHNALQDGKGRGYIKFVGRAMYVFSDLVPDVRNVKTPVERVTEMLDEMPEADRRDVLREIGKLAGDDGNED